MIREYWSWILSDKSPIAKYRDMHYIIFWPGGGTPIETLYGDVPLKWVSFWQKKSLNMGPIFGPKIPKHVSIFKKISEN